MKIVGIGHYSRTGKDTLANNIVNYVWQSGQKAKKISLAWKLKQICYELYSWAGLQPPEYYDTPEGEVFRDVILPELGMTPVQVWVAMGTPAVRENVYDRTWIDYIMKTDHEVDVLVVPDVRFPNEAVEFGEGDDNVLIKTVRDGYGPKNTVADKALIGYEGWDLWAGGTMEDLDMQGQKIASWAVGATEFPTNGQGWFQDVEHLRTYEVFSEEILQEFAL
jgi:hypothetical protein